MAAVTRDSGWRRVDGVPFVAQKSSQDCGAAALSGVLRFYDPELGSSAEPEKIEAALRSDGKAGLAARDLRDYARGRGFAAFVFEGTLADLEHELELGRPVIVGLTKPISSKEGMAHYEVLIGYNKERDKVLTLDPANGPRENAVKGFMAEWELAGQVTLVVFPEERATPAPAAEL
jgi:ABC-type bacteriocin/lantibiotic exporter with double-glycine peptidase domain